MKTGAGVLLFNNEGKILAVTRKDGSPGWSLPGGAKESGEDLRMCSERELEEETGLLPVREKLRLVYIGPSVVSGWTFATFYAPAWLGTPESREPGIKLGWVTWDDLMTGTFGDYYVMVKQAWDIQMMAQRAGLFREAMQEKLLENLHKGGWEKSDFNYLFGRAIKEMQELREAVIRHQEDPTVTTRAAVLSEAADVANFVMMIADNVGALKG